ncbi:hypothetical protein OOT46_01035 [Aquabacterium sp. A7-Y]|uniref:hypothetical protein n=1 Tax=Aquabacterium sp. A7-Y TaxID=1349605 RepID=UPI00223CE83B|nr:hypothetical protein [Aquabacterium sp. A7-Y]MCW7536439.1 hypothetical protein [Aquabacterium sp. A7-Y]
MEIDRRLMQLASLSPALLAGCFDDEDRSCGLLHRPVPATPPDPPPCPSPEFACPLFAPLADAADATPGSRE